MNIWQIIHPSIYCFVVTVGSLHQNFARQCEENGTSYVIRLKENNNLREKASYLVEELDEVTRENKVDYAVVYGEFMYKAKSWPYERRVVCKVEKPENQMVYMYTFVVTNMRKQRIDTVRLKLLKIAAKVVHSARYITFKLCSSCPHKNEFYETLSNIGKLFPVFFYRDRKFSERLALSIGMFTRGEVGAGIIFIALGYNLGGPALVISVLTLVLNLILTGIFVLWVKNLALRSYAD